MKEFHILKYKILPRVLKNKFYILLPLKVFMHNVLMIIKIEFMLIT